MATSIQQPYSKSVTKLLQPTWMTTYHTEHIVVKNDNQITAIELTCP